MIGEGNKFLIVGLDGAALHLVKRWTAEGKLPNLAKMMAEGSYGHLQTVPNQNSAPAWSSFMTGKNPGKHGIYHFYEIKDNSYHVRYLNGSDLKSEPVWCILSKAGKKVGVINVPMTYPAREVNGYIVAGWDAPGRECSGFTHPEEIAAELLSVTPNYMIEPGIPSLVANEQVELAVETAKNSIRARSNAARYLMEKYPSDFVMIVFRESDVIQHYFWEYMEKETSENSSAASSHYADTILNSYQNLDLELGNLMSKMPEDGYVMVLSDHGFAASENGPPYINYILQHMGILEINDGIGGWRSKITGNMLSYFKKHTSKKTKERIQSIFPRLRGNLESMIYFSNVKWANTKAFAESTRMEVWINLKGREPLGTVSPGDEYDNLCENIRKTLYRWHDPLTRKKVIKHVFRREEIYHGDYLNKAPDILMLFEDDVKVTGVMLIDENGRSELVDCPAGASEVMKVNGVHRDNGLFILKGPGIHQGHETAGARIVDLSPTILYLNGLPVPEDMDGRVLTEILDWCPDTKRPIEKIAESSDGNDFSMENKEYSEEEAKIIESRLRALGYIE